MHVISFVLTRWITNEFEKITDKNKNNNKWKIVMSLFTALLNTTRTLKLKAQPTNAFFAAVNQVFTFSRMRKSLIFRQGVKDSKVRELI